MAFSKYFRRHRPTEKRGTEKKTNWWLRVSLVMNVLQPLPCPFSQNPQHTRETRLTESLEELGGIPNIDAFLADEAVSGRLKRFDDYGSDEVAVARKLHEFHGTRGNSAARKAALKQAMAAHDVSTHGHYGSTASLVHHFVKGSVDLDLDEVVGIAKISLHLSKLGGYRAWEMKHEAVEEKFRTFLHFECLGLKDSYEKSIKGCRAY